MKPEWVMINGEYTVRSISSSDLLRLRLPAGRQAQHPAVEDINSRRLQPVDLNEATPITRCMQSCARGNALHAAELFAGLRKPRVETRGY